ncbi:hypothetical protein [Amycolatopsis sp. Hca4]|uniref:hypothetical protein n=1 Tax=Amycolatopsis sp. Hca4 TaxID=2742131 RepID=UPI001591754A|nr:hypothetical protein [Amycolatopsis sp. Hca4]QKV76346.1 hypothetical protein HUT10_23085 [Amycolatopsis sp. Hca4]
MSRTRVLTASSAAQASPHSETDGETGGVVRWASTWAELHSRMSSVALVIRDCTGVPVRPGSSVLSASTASVSTRADRGRGAARIRTSNKVALSRPVPVASSRPAKAPGSERPLTIKS